MMELRSELRPPQLDEELVSRLAELADMIDGARPGEWEDWHAEFNRLAQTDIPFEYFQGIYGGEPHVEWVRRELSSRRIQPAINITRSEILEVVARAMPQSGNPEYYSYMMILDANTAGKGSQLISRPPDFDPSSNTWGNGRPISEYHPTPEEIAQLLGY